jgi:hypothetical protein
MQLQTEHYRTIVGQLLWISQGTRPDIAFAVGRLAQNQAAPKPADWTNAKRVMRYLKGTKQLKLTYNSGGGTNLEMFADAAYGDNADGRSTGGHLARIGNNVYAWRSKKQPTVAISTTEAEYQELASATAEAVYQRALLNQLGFEQKDATVVHEDNQGTIALAHNPVHHTRAKHINVKWHFVREKIMSKEVEVKYIPTGDQLADIMTKALAGPAHEQQTAKLGIK